MEFHGPTRVEDAVKLLAADEDARCLAGGATLVAMMNADLLMPSALVSLRHVEGLKGIEYVPDGGLRIGSMTTHHAVATEDDLAGAHTLLRQAAAVIGHPAIRNMGTMGGSIGHGDPAADYPAALVALDAGVEAECTEREALRSLEIHGSVPDGVGFLGMAGVVPGSRNVEECHPPGSRLRQAIHPLPGWARAAAGQATDTRPYDFIDSRPAPPRDLE